MRSLILQMRFISPSPRLGRTRRVDRLRRPRGQTVLLRVGLGSCRGGPKIENERGQMKGRKDGGETEGRKGRKGKWSSVMGFFF